MDVFYDIKRRISNSFFYLRKLLHIPEPVDYKYVIILFENCDSVRVPSNLIKALRIDGIQKHVFANVVQQLVVNNDCTEFSIDIKNEALNLKTIFEEYGDSSNSFENHVKIYKDITHIIIKPTSSKKLSVGVPYQAESELIGAPNLLQKNNFNARSFQIVIKK